MAPNSAALRELAAILNDKFRQPDYGMVFTSTASTGLVANTADTTIPPQKPMASGRLVEFGVSIIDPVYGSAVANPELFYAGIGARVFVAGRPITGTGANDYMPLDVLLGTKGNPRRWFRKVSDKSEIRVELKSLYTSTVPPLVIRLIPLIASDNPPNED
jgi:hypothetical protein